MIYQPKPPAKPVVLTLQQKDADEASLKEGAAFPVRRCCCLFCREPDRKCRFPFSGRPEKEFRLPRRFWQAGPQERQKFRSRRTCRR